MQELKGIIFDVDGTLYNKTPVRLRMAIRLFGYLLIHPAYYKEVLGIYEFRRLRESEEAKAMSFDNQIELVASKISLKKDVLSNAINLWMFEKPLDLIPKYKNRVTNALFKKAQRLSVKVIVYSDYKPDQKLEALGLTANYVFYPGQDNNIFQKPCEKSMDHILSLINIPPENLIYIGDRAGTDGESAKYKNIRYIDVRNENELRQIFFKELHQDIEN